jgi:hypothetical protein
MTPPAGGDRHPQTEPRPHPYPGARGHHLRADRPPHAAPAGTGGHGHWWGQTGALRHPSGDRARVLADLRTGRSQQPPGLCHEFVHLILDRMVINADREHVEATITWRTGTQQQLWIERPLIRRSGKVPGRRRTMLGCGRTTSLRRGRHCRRGSHSVRTWPFGHRAQCSGSNAPTRGCPSRRRCHGVRPRTPSCRRM